MKQPPRKQVLDGNKIRFQDQTVDPNQKTTQQLLRFVRTVRNNLFHGGKYLPNGEVEVGRNKKLVESALYVLQTCVKIDQQVFNSFEL
jgi:ribosome-associated protein YbcJ (S4-like RNA binding protein)